LQLARQIDLVSPSTGMLPFGTLFAGFGNHGTQLAVNASDLA
jgi:hypothetical protein